MLLVLVKFILYILKVVMSLILPSKQPRAFDLSLQVMFYNHLIILILERHEKPKFIKHFWLH